MNFKQWLLLTEANISSLFDKDKPSFKIKFNDVKFNTEDKYYVDLKNSINNIDINKIKIGDKIQDYVVSETPYWKVIDINNNILYLKPIKPNPFVPNASGEIVGAGGHVFNQHDFDVMSGDYESDRIDHLLDLINKKNYHDISDIAYILLGTVPTQGGPNGSQGGWYNSSDRHNRGKIKGMEEIDIIKKDANTIKNKLKLSVPDSALDGSINPTSWNNFVQSGDMYGKELEKSKLPEEHFSDPSKMAEIVLSHQQPYIRKRNAELLIKAFYDNSNLLPLIKNTAIQIAKQPSYGKEHDKNYLLKEKFIFLAKKQNWPDVLHAFHDSPHPSNRRSIADSYGEHENLSQLLKMLVNEESPEAIERILSNMYRVIFKEHYNSSNWDFPLEKEDALELLKNNPIAKQIVSFICTNKNKIKKTLVDDDYYSKDANYYLKKFIDLCN